MGTGGATGDIYSNLRTNRYWIFLYKPQSKWLQVGLKNKQTGSTGGVWKHLSVNTVDYLFVFVLRQVLQLILYTCKHTHVQVIFICT